MEQRYPGEDDARAHFGFLLRAFRDARYMRVDDRPLLAIYEPRKVPRPYIELWRRLAESAGLKGLFMLGVRHLRDRSNPQLLGLDGAIDMRIPLPARSWVADSSVGVIMDHAEIAHLESPTRVEELARDRLHMTPGSQGAVLPESAIDQHLPAPRAAAQKQTAP